MTNKRYIAGRSFEYKMKRAYEARGFHVIRAAGSHGKYDIICLDDDWTPTLVQCKVAKSTAAALSLMTRFYDNPPLKRSGKYRQILAVYDKETRQVREATV